MGGASTLAEGMGWLYALHGTSKRNDGDECRKVRSGSHGNVAN
jgi:hypothetical protein